LLLSEIVAEFEPKPGPLSLAEKRGTMLSDAVFTKIT
jgi:hypothetical protein